MLRKRQTKLIKAAWAAAPLGMVVAGNLLFVGSAMATEWTGGAGVFSDTSKWTGSPNPPSGDSTVGGADLDSYINASGWPDMLVGNGGTMSLNGANAYVSRFRIGYNGPGTSNPGSGAVILNSGSLITDQDSFIGEGIGTTGTLIVSGGLLYTKDTKHLFAGAGGDAFVQLTDGTITLSRYGVEHGAGFSTFIMSGGVVDFYHVLRLGNPSYTGTGTYNQSAPKQLQFDYFQFDGGWLGGNEGIRNATVIHSISGNGTITFDNNAASAIILDLNQNSTWSGSAGVGTTGTVAGQGSIVKLGPGALTMSGVQNYGRVTAAGGGTLVLDLSVNTTGILENTSSIILGGGTLKVLGNSSGSSSELIGRLAVGSTSTNSSTASFVGGGKLILDLNGGSSLTLDVRGTGGTTTMLRTVGSTMDVSAVNGTLGTDAIVQMAGGGVNNILGGWGTVNNYTAWGRNQGGVLVPFTGYASDTDLGATASDGTKNLKPSGTQSDVTSAVAWNSIHLTDAVGINMTGDGSIGLTAGGILANTTGSISGGTLTTIMPGTPAAAPQMAGADLVITTAQDLIVSSTIINNNGSIGLTKNGPAVLTVTAANQYTGGTSVAGGTLRLSGGDDRLSTNTSVFMSNTPGAVLDLNGTNQSIQTLQGGGSAGGEIKLGGGVLTITGNVDTAAGRTAIYEGSISGAGQVIKDGGVATFTGSSSYTGATTLRNGAVLNVTNLANGGTNSAIGAASSSAANLVLDGGTLRFAGRAHASTDRLFTLGSGGGTIDAIGYATVNDGGYGAVHFTNPGAIVMSGGSFDRTLTLTGSDNNIIGGTRRSLTPIPSSLAASLSDPAGGGRTHLIKTGTGQWNLSGNHTYTGQTSISAGTLQVNGTHTGGGDYSVASGAALAGSGTITARVNIGGGGILAPGASIGTLRVGSLSLDNATLSFEVGSAGVDKVIVTNSGGLTLSGVSAFSLVNLGGLTAGTYTLIDYAGSPLIDLSNFSLAPTAIGGLTLSLVNNVANTSVDLSVISPVTNASWGVDSDGNWSVGTNWTGGVAPNGVDNVATFGTVITAPRTVTVDAPQTVGAINFNNASSYTIAGASAITLDVGSGNAAINVQAGSHTVSAPVTLNDNLVVTSSAGTGVALTGALTATGRTVTKEGTGTVAFENVRAAALAVNAGTARISLKGTANSAAGTSVVNSLSIGAGAVLDLTNNSMVIDYTTLGTLVNDVRTHLQSGRLATSAVSPAGTKLGYLDNAALGTPKTTFGGVSVDATSILIKFTYSGDTNLDGQVDITDLAALATAWQTAGVWVNGDFNYDNFIDITDLAALATNWQLGVGAPLAMSFDQALASVGLGGVAVPEPVGLGAVALTGLLARRRRR